MIDTSLMSLVESLATGLLDRGERLASAESCTGGLIAAHCTALSGSSAWFDRGWVTYSNEAKSDLLGVDADLILHHGAVSEPVARAMAEGAVARSQAQIAVAVTGIAGPTGGTQGKPVGTVWVAWARLGQTTTAQCFLFAGGRDAVREATVVQALQGLLVR